MILVLMALPQPEDCLAHLTHHRFGPLCRWWKDAYLDSVRARACPGLSLETLYVLAYEQALLDALCEGSSPHRIPAPRSTEEP